MGKLKVAVVCSSNMNRSMEAHSVLGKKGFDVQSFGTGEQIKIPGKNPREPNCYPFGTSYDDIYKDLIAKDKRLYTENGMLHIVDRNRRIKERPEKFQKSLDKFDVILTVEERVFDLVCKKFEESHTEHNQSAHVINMDVVSHHYAVIQYLRYCIKLQHFHNA